MTLLIDNQFRIVSYNVVKQELLKFARVVRVVFIEQGNAALECF